MSPDPSQVISSEDSDSPAVYGDLFPSSGVPSGIVLDNPCGWGLGMKPVVDCIMYHNIVDWTTYCEGLLL